MRSMLPILKKNARALEDRAATAASHLDLLRDLGMNTKEQEQMHASLNYRVASIRRDIAILEQGYALKDARNG